MRKSILIGAVCLLTLGGGTGLAAANSENTVGAAPLTAFGLGARPLGMAGAHVALAQGAEAVHYNPAGLHGITGRQITSMYANQFGLFGTFSVGYAQDQVGTAFQSYGLSDIPYTDELGLEDGNTFSVGEQLLTVAYARPLGPVTVGAAAKLYNQTLESAKGNGTTLDAGLLWSRQGSPFRFAVVARNLIGQVTYSTGAQDPFDRNVVVGAAFEQGKIAVAIDKESLGPMRLGAEYRVTEQVALRAGAWKSEAWSLTAGLGVMFDRFQVDYAYEQPPVLDATHRLSFGMRF